MMERDSFHSHSRRISDSYLMHRNRSDLCDQDGNEHHPNIRIYLDDLSRKSSQNSHSHVSQSQHLNEVQFTLDVCAKLDNTDLEGDIRMPTKSLSRMNTHNSCEDEDSPLSQLLENTRRDAVLTLSEKREKKAELVRKESERSKDKTISICKLAKYSISMSFQKFREGIVSISYNLELWYSSLKLIEGNFGSSVASYFRFLRWLFLLNLVTLVISFSFLVVPQILSRFFYNTNEFPDVLKNGGTHTDRTFHDLSGLNGTLSPPLNAAALYQKNNPYAENSEFSITDILTGEGFLTATSMYYGFYKSGTLTLLEGYPYHLAPAYFFSMVVCYLIILIMVSISMASSYRKTFIETQGAHKNSLALKVFCGLDCSVATEEGADLNMKRVFNEIMETLNEKEYKNHNSSFASCVANVAIQITLNSLFVSLMAGIALLMWDLMEKHSVHLSDESPSFINTMTMAVITTLIMNILPMGFSWIVRYEDYQSPRTALFVTLLRTFLLNVVVIGTISLFWLTHLQECWETALGQEVYRLLITDFFISVFVMGLFETLWFFIQRKLRKEQYRVEFDIAWNTLNLIYNETLFLIGFYFSPLLAAVIVIKLFITFYIKKVMYLLRVMSVLPANLRLPRQS